MLLLAARYSFANAKVRALRARRLTPEDFHFLIQARDLSGFFAYLATTSYQDILSGKNIGGGTSIKSIERSLYAPLFKEYRKIAKALKNPGSRQVILALYSRFEAENLKIILRSIVLGKNRSLVSHLLYPLGSLTRLPWDDLWNCKDPAGLAKVLRGSVFGLAIRHALPQFEAQGRTFPIEVALDLAAFRWLAEATSRLSGKRDKNEARNVLGRYVDILNCLWITRLRLHFNMSPEEIVNYSLPGGMDITLKRLHLLAKSKTTSEFVENIPETMAKKLTMVREWSDFRPAFTSLLLRLLRKVLASFPFHIGVEAGYLLEKELEVQALIATMESKKQKIAPKDIARHVPMELLGEVAHV